MIENIKDIEVTDVMIKKGYTTLVSELFNQNDDDKTKIQIQSICLSEAIKSSIQASTQIQELIAENKRLKAKMCDDATSYTRELYYELQKSLAENKRLKSEILKLLA